MQPPQTETQQISGICENSEQLSVEIFFPLFLLFRWVFSPTADISASVKTASKREDVIVSFVVSFLFPTTDISASVKTASKREDAHADVILSFVVSFLFPTADIWLL